MTPIEVKQEALGPQPPQKEKLHPLHSSLSPSERYELEAVDERASQQGGDLDEDSPLWLINEQLKGLLEGDGAGEDHEAVIQFLLGTGLPRDTVDRLHKAIVFGDTKERPGAYDVDRIDEALREAIGEAYDCNRVWNAWSYGTMGPSDFCLVSENDERIAEIREAVMAVLPKIPAESQGTQQAKSGD